MRKSVPAHRWWCTSNGWRVMASTHRWAADANTQVKEATSSNKGYDAESNASQHYISLQKQAARAGNHIYTYKSW